jgi:choline-sulfatase
MIGERGLWFKKNLFDQALRVPLFIAWPGCQQLPRVSAPVSLMDLLPTLLEAGTGSTTALVTDIEGRSLVPLLKTDEPGRSTYAEHLDGGTCAPRVMLREASLKIVYSEAYPVQLYNLADDPNEQINLAEDKAWETDLARLRQRVLEHWDLPALTRDVVDNQRTRRLLHRSLSKGKVFDWEHYPNPMCDSTRQVRRGDEFPAVEQRGYLHYPE